MDASQQKRDDVVSCWSCLQRQSAQEAESVREEGGWYLCVCVCIGIVGVNLVFGLFLVI